jgi:hypothetical protein
MIPPTELPNFARMVAYELHKLQTESKELISQNEAYRRYGRAQIEKWRKQGRITPRQEGNRIYYKTKQLQRL